jgi:hypothetical protein
MSVVIGSIFGTVILVLIFAVLIGVFVRRKLNAYKPRNIGPTVAARSRSGAIVYDNLRFK